MPRPAESGRRYLPGIDGLRAVAVLAVIGYHLGFSWVPGGLLGVGVFFTLSGYLITDLLLEHGERHGRLGLARFWLARARRLLPALLIVIVVVTAWVTVAHRPLLHGLRGLVTSSLGFVSNWWLIGQHVSYFARFQPPSPLEHLWSLAVEEQFYLLWPWLLLLGVLLLPSGSRRGRVRRVTMAAATLTLAVASAVWMAVLYQPGFDMTRIYEGTDTRAFGLLVGAALAMVWPSRRLRAPVRARVRAGLDAAGVAGLAVVLLLIVRTDQYSSFLYRGGMVLLAIATVVVVAVVAHPASRLGPVLGCAPLRWIGVRSYGIYLWHLPVIVLTGGGSGGGTHPLRATLQVAATIVLAAASWRFVEDPIRRGVLGRMWRRRHIRRPVSGWGWTAPALAVVVLATAFVGLVAPTPRAIGSELAASTRITIRTVVPSAARAATPTNAPVAGAAQAAGPSDTPSASSPAAPSVTPAPSTVPPLPAASTTACTSVVHIGDSTSEGLVSPSYLPDPAQRIDAQYARVGVGEQHLEIIGGTSVLETAEAGQPNAFTVASQLVNSGYHGCWVLALGTNDTADVAVGSALDRAGRIARMMTLLAGQPVLWVNVRSLRDSGPYSEANMQAWDDALAAACPSYPTMRIYDWASVVQNGWFINDGIHFTTPGYAQRAQRIADALVHAFPAGRPASGACTVN